MEILEQLGAFMQGLRSVLDIPGMVRHTISGGISEGITEGLDRNWDRLKRAAMKFALMFISVFFIAWGASQVFDNMLKYPGLGYVIVGCIAGILWLIMGFIEK